MVLIPVIICSSAFSTYRSYKNTMEETTQIYQRFTQSVCDDMYYLQADMVDIATYFAVNAKIHNVLISSAESFGNDRLFWYNNTPIAFLQDILAIKNPIKTVILYPENGLNPYYQCYDGSVQNKDFAQIRQHPMYEKACSVQGDVVWYRYNVGEDSLYLQSQSDRIVACRMLYDLSKRKKLGFLVIGMDVAEFETICTGMIQYENEGMVVLGDDGEIFVQAGAVDEQILESLQSLHGRDEPLNGKEPFMKVDGRYVFHESNELGMTVYYISPEGNWSQRLMNDLLLPAFLLVALLVCSWPMSMLVSYSLARPLAALHISMEKFKKGDFEQQVEVINDDEIGQLSVAFNQMAKETKELVEKNYIMQLREKESELDALQAQINPHFLYNVLDSLYWQAVGDDNEKIAEDILALSKLFRLLLSQGQADIPVSREMELVTAYLQIQNMRFSKRLRYQIDIEEEILGARIQKLMIQPFVENSVVHGLEGRENGGTVCVTGKREGDYLHFTVIDDGVGMEQEEADRILYTEGNGQKTGLKIGSYAISNIRERLVLRYGEDFQLTIKSAVDQGTRVDLIVPMEEQKGE